MGWVALFPGQGSQSVGMGAELAAEFAEAREVFDEADDVLGERLSRLCFEGPDEQLVLTRNTQPALLTVSVAAWRVLAARVESPPVGGAGHSLGEYSALVAAGVLEFADALKAVRLRGDAMQDAVPVGVGAMAAVIGLDGPAVEELCREFAVDEALVAANFNAPDQIVVAGHSTAVQRLVAAAPGRGAKRAIPLAVSAPFHSPLMRPAAERMAAYLETIAFRPGRFPIVGNVDARPSATPDAAREKLVAQVASPVRWVATMLELESGLGGERGVEIGPGKVLAGLARRINERLRVTGFSRPEDLEPALAAIAAPRSAS